MTEFYPEREDFVRARTLVVHPFLNQREDHRSHPRDPSLRLEEAIGLAQAIELNVIDAIPLKLRQISPALYLGSGQATEIKGQIEGQDIELVVVDAALSPIQQRNLEKKWKAKVIDRTALILEIFGARARTAEGRLQVELAALLYQRSRLVRSWTHLERQRGGLGFVGGPGETQIEVDRRLIDERIITIKKALEKVAGRRQLHRKTRQAVPYPIVALVGYTNAGKSTLFNRLTQSDVLAENMLFATLDPTMRTLRLPSGRRVILSDTVGFISHLPTQLIASFRATLEEIHEADLLLHVRDISHPESREQAEDVHTILHEMDLDSKMNQDMLTVLNKVDLIEDQTSTPYPSGHTEIPVSGLTGQGIEQLLAAIDRHFSRKERIHHITISVADGVALSWLHTHGKILEQTTEDMDLKLLVRLSEKNYAQFKDRFPIYTNSLS